MTNDPAQHPGEEAHLEPLPDPPQPAPAPPDPAPLEELPAETVAAPAGGSGRGAARPSGPSPASLAARQQEKAPQLLKKAAGVLVVGSLFPWIGAELATSEAATHFALKLGLLGACYLIMQGVDAHYAGDAAKGLGAKRLFPKARGMLGAFNGLHVVGIVAIVGLLALQAALVSEALVYGESLTLLLGGLTFAHIDSYLKGGKFSPLFPLMFGGCALGGLFGLFGRISSSQWLGALGCAIVTVAGVLAVYTIVVAMVQAKKEGDLKKAAALEARKQARSSAGGRQSPG